MDDCAWSAQAMRIRSGRRCVRGVLKFGRLGVAEHLAGDRWRLAQGLEATLRQMGERGDIVRTMQREPSARNLERAAADRAIFDPASDGAVPIVGRVILRGLADEHDDRHYLIVDGVDGCTHCAAIGRGGSIEPLPENAIVRIAPRASGARPVDRTVAEVAAANGGRYTIDAHLWHDPTATEAFAQTHFRRLEAMRRLARGVDREPVADHPVAVREAGFGREVRAAQALRRQWLIEEGLAEEQEGVVVGRPGMLAVLRRRELLRVAGRLSDELGAPFTEVGAGDRVEGRLVRSVGMTSGRHALIERSRDFTRAAGRACRDEVG